MLTAILVSRHYSQYFNIIGAKYRRNATKILEVWVYQPNVFLLQNLLNHTSFGSVRLSCLHEGLLESMHRCP